VCLSRKPPACSAKIFSTCLDKYARLKQIATSLESNRLLLLSVSPLLADHLRAFGVRW
jgi:hypothetical protein